MKKLIATLTIAAIALTSTFAVIANPVQLAGTDTNNVIINGFVTEIPYSFNLKYSTENADKDNSFLKKEKYDLSKTEVQSTNFFSLQRSSGNLNKDLSVSVDITAKAFEGVVNGDDVTTKIVPIVQLVNDDTNNYANVTTQNNKKRNIKTFNVTVPYGYNSVSAVEIASFQLNITGDETTDAGTYTSDVVVNYTYDQN